MRTSRARALPLFVIAGIAGAWLPAFAPPTHAAEQVHWTFTGPTSVTFDWAGPDRVIRFGRSAAYGETRVARSPSPMPVSSDGPFWEARLTGLAPNTVYHYAIGDGPDRTFRTPPRRGAAGFTVMVQGDVGDSGNYDTVLPVQQLIAAANPHFVLVVGDLAYGDQNGPEAIDQHFNDVMAWSERAAYMPIWGNHEWGSGTDMSDYKGRFDFPNPQESPNAPREGCCGEDWYWFDYGNTRFIAYPEPYSGAWSDWADRADALMSEVDEDAEIRFIVTFGHRPAYSSGSHEGSSSLADRLERLATRHPKYVLNLNGHSHNYERTHPQAGVVHITAGAGGSSLDPAGSSACPWDGGCPGPYWSAVRAHRHGAVKLRFEPDAIQIEALCGPPDEDASLACEPGDVIDSYRIVSQDDAPVADAPLGLSPHATPNPVRGSTVLTFATRRAGPLQLALVDITGRRIRTLVERPALSPGTHHVWIAAYDKTGRTLEPGIYFITIRTADGLTTERISVVP